MSISTTVPVGTIIASILTANNLTEGWYLCNGQQVKAKLPIANYIMPVNNEVTLPNLSGCTLIGAGQANSGNIYTLFNTGGEEQHTLIEDEIPSHSHSFGGLNQTLSRCTEEGGGRFDCYPGTLAEISPTITCSPIT
ncbi:hypothetical protein [Fluviicola taffensis]|uniref:hypothetical protein n=1 Tax=Fluviicola taffensis TaxID=191579 RepID=UPI003137719F